MFNTWRVQGYYHHGKALLAVGRAWDARNSFAQALALAPKTPAYVEGLAEAEAAYTSARPPLSLLSCVQRACVMWNARSHPGCVMNGPESYYSSVKKIFLKDGSVEVRYIDAERGKVSSMRCTARDASEIAVVCVMYNA